MLKNTVKKFSKKYIFHKSGLKPSQRPYELGKMLLGIEKNRRSL